MLTNYHTHTTFCDGKDTVEQMVCTAIEKGFDALGFSGHGYTPFDLRYCMMDTVAYRHAVLAAKEKYASRLQIYLGTEEDMHHLVNRSDYDYIIGSCHYVLKDGIYYSVDSGQEYHAKCLAVFDRDPRKMAHAYFGAFSDYILRRKPDIVGHFDLLTKYDALNDNVLLENPEYLSIAEAYMEKALESDCIFEVNTGHIARGIRKAPYPSEHLLHIMKKHDAKLILSSDCHDRQMLDCCFEETKQLLHEIGFRRIYVLYDGVFQSVTV